MTMLKQVRFVVSFYIQRFKNIYFSNLSCRGIEKYREKQISRIVRYALKKSEFYMKLYANFNLSEKINIEKLPIITKDDIVDSFNQLITVSDVSYESLQNYFLEPFNFEKRFNKKYLAFHTSGSTGNPIYVIWGEDVFGKSLSSYFFKIKSIVKMEKLKKIRVAYVGITDDYVGGNSWVYGMKRFANIKIFSIFLPESELTSELNKFQPDIVFTKPSCLGELARKQNAGILNIHPKKLIFAGEMISPVDLKCIQQYFGLKPINSYSTCETGPVAIQTDVELDGLEILEDLVYVELVDDEGKIITNNYQVGNVVITNLYNKYLPIIRYKIGDKAYFIPNENSTSGRRLSYIQGRGTSFFTLKDMDENTVRVAEFPFWSLYIPGILRYQVIQISYIEFLIRIEYERSIIDSEVKEVNEMFVKKIKRILEPYKLQDWIKLTIKQVDKICPNISGKIQVTSPLRYNKD